MRVLWVGLLGLSFLFSCERKKSLRIEEGIAFGTTWRLVQNDPEAPERKKLVSRLLAQQEVRFSNWSPTSEVSRLERGVGEASSELKAILALAEKIGQDSQGAFDISWNGGFDLAGIAKGWSVDQVTAALLREGCENFVFELGGEVKAHGHGPEGSGWLVGIENPSLTHPDLVRTVRLHNEALATSGNYQQPQHLKDGRTGEAVSSSFRSVSVVMPSCAAADAWATALFVLGKTPADFAAQVFWNEAK